MSRKVKCLAVVICAFGFLVRSSRGDGMEMGSPPMYCADLNPQNTLDIQQITGMWYGSELLQHHDGIVGETSINSCVVIHLSEITHEITTTQRPDHEDKNYRGYYERSKPQGPTYNYLRLIWDEKGEDLEYTLRYNQSRRGFWIASNPQTGTLLDMTYNQFTGTLQVMKAVKNHLVLTFCQTLPKGQLFSIVLSRRPNTLTSEEIHGIRSLLKRRGLQTSSVRKVCQSGAASSVASALLTTLITVLLAMVNHI